MSKKTRVAVDGIRAWLQNEAAPLPAGLELTVTGTAVVGHDTNVAASESIKNTTVSTIALVVLILLFVYRSPLLAMIPLLTIAISVFVSLRLIALLARALSGPSSHQYHAGVCDCRPLWRGHRLLPVPDRPLFRRATARAVAARGFARIAPAGWRRLVASAGTVIVGLGMLYFSNFAKVRYTGPTIALSLSVALLAALSLAPAMLALLGRAIFWPFHKSHQTAAAESGSMAGDSLPRPGFWVRVADLVVQYPLTILSVCLWCLLPWPSSVCPHAPTTTS